MKQIKEWDGTCQKCNEKSETHTLSVFGILFICMQCYNEEKKIAPNTVKINPIPEIANDPIDW